jgi:hypothetical protein
MLMPPEGPSVVGPVDMRMLPELELARVAGAVTMDTAPDAPAEALAAPEAILMKPPEGRKKEGTKALGRGREGWEKGGEALAGGYGGCNNGDSSDKRKHNDGNRGQ